MFLFAFYLLQAEVPSNAWWVVITTLAASIGAMAWYITKLHKDSIKDAKEHSKEKELLAEKFMQSFDKNTDALREVKDVLKDVLRGKHT